MSTLLHSSPAESLHIQHTKKCQPFCILHQLSHYIYNRVTTYTTYHKMSTFSHSSPAESLHIQHTTKCQPFCILHQLSFYIYNIPQNVNPFEFFTSWVTTYTTYHKMSTLLHSSPAESLHIRHTTKCQPFCILHQLSNYIYNIPQNVNPFAFFTSWVTTYTTYHKM